MPRETSIRIGQCLSWQAVRGQLERSDEVEFRRVGANSVLSIDDDHRLLDSTPR